MMSIQEWLEVTNYDLNEEPLSCAHCGEILASIESEYDPDTDSMVKRRVIHKSPLSRCVIGDNFIQQKFFEGHAELNIFCSPDCLCKALSVEELYDDES